MLGRTLLLLVLVKESNSRRGGDCCRRGARGVVSHGVDGMDDEFVLVWLLAENEEEERLKNLHQELVLFLWALLRNVKNLNANMRFLSSIVKNLQFNVKKINCYGCCSTGFRAAGQSDTTR